VPNNPKAVPLEPVESLFFSEEEGKRFDKLTANGFSQQSRLREGQGVGPSSELYSDAWRLIHHLPTPNPSRVREGDIR
jgi:hypothetical protein